MLSPSFFHLFKTAATCPNDTLRMTTRTIDANLSPVMAVRNTIRPFLWLAVFLPLLALAVIGGRRLEATAPGDLAGDEPVYLPKAKYLAPMSLGWKNALADVLWFRTISYFGKHFRSDRTYPWLAAMCELVTDLDPRALHVYRFAGVILPWEGDQVDAGIRLLEKGAKEFPDNWLLHYHLGFSEYFFKNDSEKAVRHLQTAVSLPGAHPTIARLAAVLARKQFGPETTLAFLDELQGTVDSNDVRDVIVEQMREARLVADLKNLQAAADAYRDHFGVYPLFLDDLIYAGFLREIPKDPFDGVYQIEFDGLVSSTSGHEPSQLHNSKLREQALRGEPLRDF